MVVVVGGGWWLVVGGWWWEKLRSLATLGRYGTLFRSSQADSDLSARIHARNDIIIITGQFPRKTSPRELIRVHTYT